MATVTKPRPRVKRRRIINLSRKPLPTMPGVVRIQVGDEPWTDYNPAKIPSDFGTAFRLVKVLGPCSRYDVLLDGERSTCVCKGFLRHGYCKHIDGLETLVNRGALDGATLRPRGLLLAVST
jgi:hypothetical protein